MAQALEPITAMRERIPLRRSPADRVVSGLAAGMADRLGMDPVLIRLGFVTLACAGGVGILLYLTGWAMVPEGPSRREVPALSLTRQVAAACLIGAGTMLALRGVGLWFSDYLAFPVAIASLGSALIWVRGPADRGHPSARLIARVVGAVLAFYAIAWFVAAFNGGNLSGPWAAAFALAVIGGAGALLLGPWSWRLIRQIAEERRERIRADERSEVAAHLHDSVLQTLALIQRTEDPREMASLARTQERDLRNWLYRRADSRRNGESLTLVLDRMASRIDRLHRVPVDVVNVGDCGVDERVQALVEAAAEAAGNAARHSGAAVVSVYAEVEPERVRIYVRDEGAGFDPRKVPPDRRGISDSIRGRVERLGGTVTITSQRRKGTEVLLELPRRTP
jgi:signal transduction histidine kinase/phage shock protein PspC (stress-responsive transcriptional regulator)